jgi:hypothetical protein
MESDVSTCATPTYNSDTVSEVGLPARTRTRVVLVHLFFAGAREDCVLLIQGARAREDSVARLPVSLPTTFGNPGVWRSDWCGLTARVFSVESCLMARRPGFLVLLSFVSSQMAGRVAVLRRGACFVSGALVGHACYLHGCGVALFVRSRLPGLAPDLRGGDPTQNTPHLYGNTHPYPCTLSCLGRLRCATWRRGQVDVTDFARHWHG